jgi:hypothetical protein
MYEGPTLRDTRFRRLSVGGRTCTVCGAPLNTHPERAEGVCRSLKCRGPMLQQRKHAHDAAEARQRAQLREIGITALRVAVPQTLDQPRPPVVMILPSFASHLGPQPAERKRALQNNLQKTTKQAADMLDEPGRVEVVKANIEHRVGDESPLPPEAVTNACSTCRGACCRPGGEHAFLTAEFLAWRLLTEPDATPAGLVEQYLALLPDETFDNSCLFHSPTGCAIPRALRSPTCNGFLCKGIIEQADTLSRQPDSTTVTVAVDNGVPQRVGFYTTDGMRHEARLGE